jgi:5-methylcytosine-specific restriction endonuclease McrA
MDADLRSRVRVRAGDRCEYCGLHQDREPYYRFHIEHIVARQHGGSDALENLALACFSCNVDKGTNLTAIDPVGGQIVPVFNPRLDRWDEHFALRNTMITGLTAIGRATVQLLKMNAPERVELRYDA